MNFDVMPELHWEYGYPVALGDGGFPHRALPDLQAASVVVTLERRHGADDCAVEAVAGVPRPGTM
jgi:hypothetical protein